MITHENTDISIAAVGLLHEMTDVDTILEEESAMVFIDALINSQGKYVRSSHISIRKCKGEALIHSSIHSLLLFGIDVFLKIAFISYYNYYYTTARYLMPTYVTCFTQSPLLFLVQPPHHLTFFEGRVREPKTKISKVVWGLD